MSGLASLLWQGSSVQSLNLETLAVTQSAPGELTSEYDVVNSTIFCGGNLACAGTLWAHKLRSSTRTLICDEDYKCKMGLVREALSTVRQINIHKFVYKQNSMENDDTAPVMYGPMAQQLLTLDPALVDIKHKEEGGPLAIYPDSLCSLTLQAVKDLDKVVSNQGINHAQCASVIDMQKQQLTLCLDKLAEQDARIREQADRLRAQDDRLRAQDDRLRAMEVRFHQMSGTIQGLCQSSELLTK